MTAGEKIRSSPPLQYAALIFAAVVILIWQWWSWEIDPAIPLNYWGDSIPVAVYTKGIIENGWHLVNPSLGMPDRMELYDYPLPTNLPFLIIKLLSILTHKYALVLNLYVALCCVLSAVTAFFVFKKWTRHALVAFIGSLLFAFQPYQILRGWQGHIFLSTTFLVPLVILIVMKVAMGTAWTKRQRAGAILVMFLVSAGSIYYSFFAAYFLLMAGVYAAAHYKKFRSTGLAAILICAVLLGTSLNLFPTILASFNDGENPQATERGPVEAEHLGLRISTLLLPTLQHRIPWLRKAVEEYHVTFDSGESTMASLGILGSAGFLFLLALPFFRKPGSTLPSQFSVMSYVNFAAIILASMGSLASLIAYFVTEQLRGYNRISIFIAFLSVSAVTMLLDRLVSHKQIFKQKTFLSYALLFFVLFAGIYDQTPAVIPEMERQKRFFYQDQEFIRTIEAGIPPNSMIFQLPDSNFPGGEYPIASWEVHQSGKPYLHSRTLRWTYGAIQGRGTDLWQKHVAEFPPSELVPTLIYAGFSGIYIDRNGYTDKAEALREALDAELKTKPLVSKNKRQLFYNLLPRTRELKAHRTTKQWDRERAIVQSRLIVQWSDGFYNQESDTTTTWRWCDSEGTMILHNGKQSVLKARMTMQLANRDKSASELKIESPWFSERLQLDTAAPKVFDREFLVPPGSHKIQFSSKANVITTDEDQRSLAFEIINFQLEVEIDDSTKP